ICCSGFADIQEENKFTPSFFRRIFFNEVQGFLGTRGKSRHDQVLVAVLIQIKKARTQTDSVQFVQSGLDRHIVKAIAAFAFVAKEPLFADAGNEQIGKAVVVEIADGAAEAETWFSQAGFVRDIGENIVALIAQEQIANLAAFHYG